MTAGSARTEERRRQTQSPQGAAGCGLQAGAACDLGAVQGGGIGVGRHKLHKVARAELKTVHVGCLV